MIPRPWAASAIVASAVGYGSLAIFAKRSLVAGVPVGSVLSVRFVGAALVLIVAASLVPFGERFSVRVALSSVCLGAFGFAGATALYVASLNYVPASVMVVFIYMYPCWVAVLERVFRGVPFGPRRVLALVLASLGISATASPFAEGHAFGVLLAALAGVMFGIYVFLSATVAPRMHPLRVSASVMVGAAVSSVTVAGFSGQLQLGAALSSLPELVGMVILATVLPVFLFYAGLTVIDACSAAILSCLEPFATVLLAFLVLGEVVTLRDVAGAALVAAAAVLVIVRDPLGAVRALVGERRRKQRTAITPPTVSGL